MANVILRRVLALIILNPCGESISKITAARANPSIWKAPGRRKRVIIVPTRPTEDAAPTMGMRETVMMRGR
ncbi:MAG TPA: hypothetical protein ENF41_02035 [Candidatus Bathyarchaeota archaeon]|nr:hypothetical protein [Candidatus Bathyarchaeota archaeon]